MEAPPRAKEEVDLGISLPLTLQQCRRVITEDRACGREMDTTLGHQALSGFRAKLMALLELLRVMVLSLWVTSSLGVAYQKPCISGIYL